MTTTHANPPPAEAPAKYANGAEWMHALGDIPLERVVMDPAPGTATEADLLRMVEAEDRLVELIDGTLVEKPVGFDEALIASMLITLLNIFVLPRKLGSVYGPDATMRMKRNRIRLPDVSFISAARLATLPKPHPSVPSIAPDLAVEVLSKTNTRKEIAQKLQEYFESGTRLAWIVDPRKRTLAVYEGPTEQPARILKENDKVSGDPVIPGFEFTLSEIFAEVT
jgi:Uma2 family endonuclease